MATTSQTTSKDGQEFSKGNAPELGQNVGAKELGQEGANPVSSPELGVNELSTAPTAMRIFKKRERRLYLNEFGQFRFVQEAGGGQSGQVCQSVE